MFQILFVLMNTFSFPVFADDGPLDRCGSMADRNLKSVVQVVEFPVEFIQWGLIDRIERVNFVSTTPGTLEQEYAATYRLTYKASPYALFQEQTVEVRFAAPFACEDLKLRCMQVVSNKLAEKTDSDRILKFGPLNCEL